MTERYDPFAEIEQLLDQVTQVGRTSRVPVDVVETEEAVLVRADLPGRDSSDFEVRLEGERTLHVDAGDARLDPEGTVVTQECERGPVSRSVRLPAAVDADGTEADYDRGVLEVHLPKQVTTAEGTDIPVN